MALTARVPSPSILQQHDFPKQICSPHPNQTPRISYSPTSGFNKLVSKRSTTPYSLHICDPIPKRQETRRIECLSTQHTFHHTHLSLQNPAIMSELISPLSPPTEPTSPKTPETPPPPGAAWPPLCLHLGS